MSHAARFWHHPCMLVDPNVDHNNHDAVLIDRALYRAMARLLDLENRVISLIRTAFTSTHAYMSIKDMQTAVDEEGCGAVFAAGCYG